MAKLSALNEIALLPRPELNAPARICNFEALAMRKGKGHGDSRTQILDQRVNSCLVSYV